MNISVESLVKGKRRGMRKILDVNSAAALHTNYELLVFHLLHDSAPSLTQQEK